MSAGSALRVAGVWILALQQFLMVAGLPGSGISKSKSEKAKHREK